MRDPRARLQETMIGVSFIAGECPACDRQVAEKNKYVFDELLQHMRTAHTMKTPKENKVLSMLQQCLIFSRSRNAGTHRRGMIGRKRRDRMCTALRTLNKEGMGISLLKVLFDLQIPKIGDYTYHGMELLGKPDWVKNVELENVG